ncbi:MAG TPA: hypothetical protein VFC90_08240 [Planctomycetota bacterium]|nr:hypothetical protein [Planctomycetota bacterium]
MTDNVATADLNEGDTVCVTKGAFSNFSGAVERVDAARGTVRVAIPMFEKSTTVELDLDEVERIQG